MKSMSAVKRDLCVLTKSRVTDRAAKWAEGIVVGLHPPLFVASSVEDMLAVKSDKWSSSHGVLAEFTVLDSLFLWRLSLFLWRLLLDRWNDLDVKALLSSHLAVDAAAVMTLVLGTRVVATSMGARCDLIDDSTVLICIVRLSRQWWARPLVQSLNQCLLGLI